MVAGWLPPSISSYYTQVYLLMSCSFPRALQCPVEGFENVVPLSKNDDATDEKRGLRRNVWGAIPHQSQNHDLSVERSATNIAIQ
jgi:hypothetical protein